MQHQVLSSESRQHTFVDVMRAFVLAESRGLTAALWRPFWKVGLGVAVPVLLALTYFTLFRRLVVPASDPPLVVTWLVLLGFSLLYGALAGCAAALVNAGRRLVGTKFFWMLPAVGLGVLMTVSLLLGWIRVDGKNAAQALSASAARRGFAETAAALDADRMFAAGRFAQLGAPLQVLVSPFLVTETPQVLADGDFLWYYFLFIKAVTVAVLLGLIPSYAIALGVLWKAGCTQLAARYRKFVADYGVVARYNP